MTVVFSGNGTNRKDSVKESDELLQPQNGCKVSLVPMTDEMYDEYFLEYDTDPDTFYDKTEYHPFFYCEDWVRRYIGKQKDRNRFCFAIRRENETVGELKLTPESDKAFSLSISMKNSAFKDRGFGTEAERLAVDYAFSELGAERVLADTILTNTRSQHVLEKVGFHFVREEGIFRYYEIQKEKVCQAKKPE